MTISLKDNEKIKIINSDDIYKIMQQVLLRENKIDRDKEHFWVAGLAVNNKLLFIELISLGSQTATIVSPMEIFSVALQKRAASIILVHNHPSGDLKPSENDKDITDRLMVVGKIVDTPVLDHLIISETEYLSFEKVGLIKELEKSLKFKPTFMLEDEIKEQISKNINRERSFEIAKELKKQKVENDIIVQCTGLTIEEIEEIKL